MEAGQSLEPWQNIKLAWGDLEFCLKFSQKLSTKISVRGFWGVGGVRSPRCRGALEQWLQYEAYRRRQAFRSYGLEKLV